MNRCETLHDNLKAYADGELPMAARLRLRLHLARCAACRQEVAAMERIGKELRAADAGGLDPALRAKLLSVFPEDAMPAPSQSRAKWSLHSMQTWAAAAGVLLICVVFYPLFQRAQEVGRTSSSDSVPEAPSKSMAGGKGASAEAKKEMVLPGRPMGNPGTSQVSAPSAAPPAPGNKVAGKPMPKAFGNALAGGGGNAGSFGAEGRGRNFGSGTTGSFGSSPSAASGGSFGGNQARSFADSKTAYSRKPVEQEGADNGMEPGGKPGASTPNLAVNVPRVSKPDVVKRAVLLVEVDELSVRSAEAERMVRDVNGTVVRKQPAAGEGPKATTLILRIPVKRLDSFLDRAAQLGEVKSRNLAFKDRVKQESVQEQPSYTLHDEGVPAKAKKAKVSEPQPRKARAQEEAEHRRQRQRRAKAKERLQTLPQRANTATVTLELRAKRK